MALSRRVETTYLGTLRVVVLVVATLFIVTAGYFLVQGTARISTSTTVTEEPVKVRPDEVIAGVATKKDVDSPESSAAHAQDEAEKKLYQAFLRGPFVPYYNAYNMLARRYDKADDRILTVEQLAENLGYTLDAFRSGEDDTVRQFVTNSNYAAQITAAATALGTDKRVQGQLQQYRAAQKTAQSCSTDYVSRRVWDPSSTACSNWYQYPMGCSVLRDVPVQHCVAAYPEGITSPADAFAQMDKGFRTLWANRQKESSAAAESKRNALLAQKASGMPTLLQAAQVFGAFLVVMFLFLVIAIERHLRRLSKNASTTALEPDSIPLAAE